MVLSPILREKSKFHNKRGVTLNHSGPKNRGAGVKLELLDT